MLALFARDTNLQQYVDHPIVATSLPVDEPKQAGRLGRVDHRDERGDELHLVRLQAADQMPLDVAGQLGLLGRQLLRTVFPENALAGLVGPMIADGG